MSETKSSTEKAFAKDFIDFLNASPSHFHAVAAASSMLKDAGYTQISETDQWNLQPGGKYFFTRNQSSIVAFAVGGKYKKGNGFVIFGAHTDSPVLKVKPVSKTMNAGFLQVGVQPYGGGLWHTWFDRDLSLAGRVIVADKDGKKFESKLVQFTQPLLRIPNLAIHLDRAVNTDGFKPNAQTHVLPVLATSVKAALEKSNGEEENKEHHNTLLNLISTSLKVEASQLRNFELCLYDTQPATLGGLYGEFIFARGLDNLMMSYVSTRALIDSGDSLGDDETIRMVALFDNEEIGSESLMGAASSMMPQLLKRIHGGDDGFESAIRRSFLVSADMAHAVHPNYSEKHEPQHRPQMHQGLVLKENANLRYATNAISAFFISEVAKRHNIPLQKFCVRNDTACGSTIGPILSTSTGIRTVDVGIPQLSMHSIREMAGTADALSSYELFKHIFAEFAALDKQFPDAQL